MRNQLKPLRPRDEAMIAETIAQTIHRKKKVNLASRFVDAIRALRCFAAILLAESGFANLA